MAADGQRGNWQGVWCWGSPRRSSETPFLKIEHRDGRWTVQTKNYMHDNFEPRVRAVHLGEHKLDFVYWYEPLGRWAKCTFSLSGDVMSGRCDAETSAQSWGSVDSYLWRAGVLTRPTPVVGNKP
jgi:hypothetical protein